MERSQRKLRGATRMWHRFIIDALMINAVFQIKVLAMLVRIHQQNGICGIHGVDWFARKRDLISPQITQPGDVSTTIA